MTIDIIDDVFIIIVKANVNNKIISYIYINGKININKITYYGYYILGFRYYTIKFYPDNCHKAAYAKNL